jgi:hypothetical protein
LINGGVEDTSCVEDDDCAGLCSVDGATTGAVGSLDG